MKKEDVLFTLSWAFRLFIDFIGYVGALLVAYELVAYTFSSRWAIIDRWANPFSTLLTIIGTFITAVSIYFYTDKPNPPEKVSIYIGGPMIIVMCIVAMIVFLRVGNLPANVVNGFSLMALAGALYRVHINPLNDERAFWKFKKNP